MYLQNKLTLCPMEVMFAQRLWFFHVTNKVLHSATTLATWLKESETLYTAWKIRVYCQNGENESSDGWAVKKETQ